MKAKQALKYYQNLFRLQNWDIQLEVHKVYEDEEMEGNDGYVRMMVANLRATIVINENSTEPIERIIAHECLHILLRDITSPLNALFHTEDAEDVFSLVDELLVRRLENAFMEVKCEDGEH